MPDFRSHATAIRASGHSIRCYASFFVGTVVASGTLLADPNISPAADAADVAVTFLVGTDADCAYGMEITFGDTMGNFKGRSHIRYGGVLNILNIPIREYGLAKLDLAAGDTFQVYGNDYRIHDKLVAATSTFDPDQLAYTDQGLHPPPVACSGGHTASFTDRGQTYATVVMTGSTSYLVDPASATPVTHLWTLPSGVTFAPGSASTDADPTLRAVVGKYTIFHAVTDPDNSKVTIQHPTIQVETRGAPTHEIILDPPTLNPETGFSWHAEVISGDASLIGIPDGCLAVLWSEDRTANQWVAYRNKTPGRSHILGVGIVRRDMGSGDSELQHIAFDVISPLARLKEITSYSKFMVEAASPAAWSQIYTLKVRRGIIQIIQAYCTLIEAGFDFIFLSTFLDKVYPSIYLQRADFYGQIIELARGVDGVMVCDRTGRFELFTKLQYIPYADRAAITVTWEFDTDDWVKYEWTREHFDVIELFKASGFSAGASPLPLFSLYPGIAPGEGVETPVSERLIVDDQADLNDRVGRYGAEGDHVLMDGDGVITRALSDLKLTLPGSYDFFDVYQEYILLTLPNNKRDLDFTGVRFYMTNVAPSYDADTLEATVDLTLRMETNAHAGESFTPTPPPDLPPSNPPPPPNQPPFIIGNGTRQFAAFTTDNYLIRTTTLTSALWEAFDVSADVSGNVIDFVPDPFSPNYLGTGANVNGWIACDDGTIYRVTNIMGSYAISLEHTTPSAPLSDVFLQAERCASGWVMMSYYNTSGVQVAERDTGGTWHDEVVTTHYDSGAPDSFPALWMSPGSPGAAYIIAATSTTAPPPAAGYVHTTIGGAWSSDGGNPNFATYRSGGRLEASVAAPSVFYFTNTNSAGSNFSEYKVTGATQTNVSPAYGGHDYGARLDYRAAIRVDENNPNYAVLIGDRDNTSIEIGVWRTRSGISAAAWELVYTPDNANEPKYRNCFVNYPLVMIWGAGYIAQSLDFLATLTDYAGNLFTLGVTGNILNICGARP